MSSRRGLALLTSVLATASLTACSGGTPPTAGGKAKGSATKAGATKTATPSTKTPSSKTPAAPPTTPEAKKDEVKTDPLPKPPASPHPFGVRDLIAMDRLGAWEVSPDGKTIVFVRSILDHASGKAQSDLWSVPVAGGEPQRLTDDDASDGSPRFSPDGKTVFFLSSRSGSRQVWRMPASGGEAEQVTDLPLPLGDLRVSPAGDRIAFTTAVFTDCEDLQCTADRLEAKKRNPSTGHVYDQLFVRHWDHYRDGRRSHLFTMALSGGAPVDLVRFDSDVPSQPFGGAEDYVFSPDGKNIVFVTRNVQEKEAWSTNFDLYSMAADGGSKPVDLTSDNEAWDANPVFSPDGKTLAWTAMATPGYESDRFVIKVRDWASGEVRTIAEDWDRSVRSMVFAPDSASLLVTAQHLGQVAMFRITLADGTVTELAGDGKISGPAFAGERIVFARQNLRRPTDLWSMPATGGEPMAVTQLNAERLEGVSMGEPEQFDFPGWKGEKVYGYMVKPAGFEEGKTYPLAFLIHGGPQGSFGNMFHYRWNAQTYAGAGYAVVMIDFHGSTGYGQAFTDSIQGDWGGKPLVDLQKGLDAALARYPFIDGEKVCALGASYGGFMINWIAGNWSDRFRCLVNHDGLFDNRMAYYATEELWFPEREHGGPHYENPGAYEKHNPVNHVSNWKTPMMVVHGSLDYRVTETQGLATFTALQRRGIDSRYLHFPDENHWVLSRANSVQWHTEVEAWLARWLREPAAP